MTDQQNLDLFGDEGPAVLSDAAELMTLNGGSLESALDLSDSEIHAAENSRLDSREFTKNSLFDGDASFPLEDPKHEAFLTQVAEGVAPMLAYLDCVSARCNKKSASEQASRLIRRPLYRARLRILIMGRRVEQQQADGEELITKEKVILELQKIAFSSSAGPGERRSALIDLAKMKGWMKGDGEKENRGLPDPALLMDYLKQAEAQGIDPVQVAQEALCVDGREDELLREDVGDPGPVSGPGNKVEAQDVVV